LRFDTLTEAALVNPTSQVPFGPPLIASTGLLADEKQKNSKVLHSADSARTYAAAMHRKTTPSGSNRSMRPGGMHQNGEKATII
jgi:hypothetical protein